MRGVLGGLALIWGIWSGLAGAQQHPARMVGKWCESDDGGQSCSGYTSYFPDGSAYAYTTSVEGNRLEIVGMWGHIGCYSCFTHIAFEEYDENTNLLVNWGSRRDFCNKIIGLGLSEFVYEDYEGERHSIYRLSDTPDRSVWPPVSGE